MTGSGRIERPLNGTVVIGLDGSLLVTCRFAVLEPIVAGANWTLTETLAPNARSIGVAGGDTSENEDASAPLMDRAVMLSTPPPPLASITGAVAAWPT